MKICNDKCQQYSKINFISKNRCEQTGEGVFPKVTTVTRSYLCHDHGHCVDHPVNSIPYGHNDFYVPKLILTIRNTVDLLAR